MTSESISSSVSSSIDALLTPRYLANGGVMGDRVREFDWSRTSLGLLADWPPGLRDCLGTCLRSPLPAMVWWGDRMEFIYNDACLPLLGALHPGALGQQGERAWPAVWSHLSTGLQAAWREGLSTHSEPVEFRLGEPLETHHFTFSHSPVYGPDGRIVGVFSILTDVTSEVLGARQMHTHRDRLKLQRQKLAEAAQHLAAALTVDEAMQILSDQARVLLDAHLATTTLCPAGDWSQAVHTYSLSERYASYRPYPAEPDSRPTGRGLYSLVTATNQPLRLSHAALLAHPRFHHYGDHEQRHPPLRGLLVVPLLSAEGKNLGLLQVSDRDQGDFSEDDEAVLMQFASLGSALIEKAKLYQRARQERARAEEANQLKDEFLAVISHELRTPLSAILGWIKILRGGSLSDDKRERALDTIERNARSQAALVEDILDVGRITSGQLRLTVTPVNMTSVIEGAVDTLRPAAEARGVRLQVLVDPDASTVLGDAGRLQQIVWNLLSNAIKFTPRGGRVHVGLKRADSHVEITVADSGQGIAPEFLPHLFDRFRQADSSTTRRHGGLGLGLTIVKHLTELHGGSIEAHSAGHDRGATFTLRIPLAPLRSLPIPRAEPSVPQPFDCPEELPGLSILVVDDAPDARDMIHSILDHCGAHVHMAASVDQALALLARQRPDVIISDVGMPHEDGYSFIRQVRALPPEQGGRTPAVALTAYARLEDRTRALRSGFNNHVAKPVDPNELLAVIGSLARRARP